MMNSLKVISLKILSIHAGSKLFNITFVLPSSSSIPSLFLNYAAAIGSFYKKPLIKVHKHLSKLKFGQKRRKHKHAKIYRK